MSEFDEYRKMVMNLQDDQSPKVLFGIEADYYSGCESYLKKWLPEQHFDFILGSVHYIQNWGFDNPDQRHVWDSIDVVKTWEEYFRLIEEMADTRLFDAVSHLDLTKKFGHRPSDKNIKEIAQPALDRIAEAGMGMEINTSGLRKPVGEIYPSPIIMSLAKERDIPICFGSDAHCPEDVGKDFEHAIKLARDTGFSHFFKIQEGEKILIPIPETLSQDS